MSGPEREIAAAAAWLREEATKVSFGEVAVRFILHGGTITRVERSIVNKELTAEGNHASR